MVTQMVLSNKMVVIVKELIAFCYRGLFSYVCDVLNKQTTFKTDLIVMWLDYEKAFQNNCILELTGIPSVI